MGVGDGAALQRQHLVPALARRVRAAARKPSEAGLPTFCSWLRERAMKLPLRSIRPASQPSGRFHCSNSDRKMLGSMPMMMHSGGLSLRQHRHLDRDRRRLQNRAVEDVGDLHLAGLDGAALELHAACGRRGSELGRAGARLTSCCPFSSAEHDPAAGQARDIARSASWRNAARSSVSSAGEVASICATAICLLRIVSTAFISVRVENRMASRRVSRSLLASCHTIPRSAA